MVEVEEIELDLGLSIGGSFSKPEKPKPVENPMEPDLRTNGFNSDLQDGQRERMSMVAMIQHAKREIHALRRQEAKKKRQQKRGAGRDWVRESEPEYQRVSKREKMEDYQNVVSGSNIAWTAPFHVQQPHQYATVQFVPLNNGFVLPCWVPSESEKNVGQTPMCIGLPPFLANGCRSEKNGEIDSVNCGDRIGKYNGSSMCSSYVVSDYQSSSHEDGASTDSHSHSAHSLTEPTLENHITSQLEQCASSHPLRSEIGNNTEVRNQTVKENLPNITQPERTTTNCKSVQLTFTEHLSNENSSNGPLKETKVDIGESPKPVTQTSCLPQMPFVSTTGNGPNGKTVNGFLYKYTKSEVSIVCVCHGSTFSPAEFVQHAGGTDISHPLRHITVLPSAFG